MSRVYNMLLRKPWKKRDVSDPDYARLGYTPDSRRNRADNIEARIWSNRGWCVTTVIAVLALVVSLLPAVRANRLAKHQLLP